MGSKRADTISKNYASVKGKINMKHYTAWMKDRLHGNVVMCNCVSPGFPNTMCCESYYGEDFWPLDWIPATPIFNSWYQINIKKYKKLRKENITFLMFLLLLTVTSYPRHKLLNMVYHDGENIGFRANKVNVTSPNSPKMAMLQRVPQMANKSEL